MATLMLLSLRDPSADRIWAVAGGSLGLPAHSSWGWWGEAACAMDKTSAVLGIQLIPDLVACSPEYQ